MNAKTYSVRESEIERRWYVVDATDETLGRLASRIAHVLEGKHKPTWSPNLDGGDHVIVLNAKKITVSAAKQLGTLTLAARAMSPTEARRRAGIASNTASWVSLKASVALV